MQSRPTYPHRDDSRMIRGMIEDAASPPHAGMQLWPKDRTILEREVMEFRPFGLDEQGHAIRDLSDWGPSSSGCTIESTGCTLSASNSSPLATVVATV